MQFNMLNFFIALPLLCDQKIYLFSAGFFSTATQNVEMMKIEVWWVNMYVCIQNILHICFMLVFPSLPAILFLLTRGLCRYEFFTPSIFAMLPQHIILFFCHCTRCEGITAFYIHTMKMILFNFILILSISTCTWYRDWRRKNMSLFPARSFYVCVCTMQW